MPRKRLLLIGSPCALVLIALALWSVVVGADSGVPATAEQQGEFRSLIRNYRWTFFNGWITGDLSTFPAVFYNDPKSPPNARFQKLIDANRGQIDAVLAGTTAGPVGARTGELAAQMADVLWRRGSAAQWQSAVATATAQGRAPSLQDVPDGEPPVMSPQPSDWDEKQIFITQATIHGDNHASVIYVLDDADSTLLYHLGLTKVNGKWYISKHGITGNP